MEDYYASGTGILQAVSGNPLLGMPFSVYPHLASFCLYLDLFFFYLCLMI